MEDYERNRDKIGIPYVLRARCLAILIRKQQAKLLREEILHQQISVIEKDIKNNCEKMKLNIHQIHIFGSSVNGFRTPHSDIIDIMIRLKENEEHKAYCALLNTF